MLTGSNGRTLLVALAVSMLMAGCTGSVPPGPDGTSRLEETLAPDAPAMTGSRSPDAMGALMKVGPLAVPAAEYWSVGESTPDVATVGVGGCDEASACPGFAVMSGDVAAAAREGEALLSDGIGCPGGESLRPESATLLYATPAEVAGVVATLETFEVTCTAPDGEQRSAAQNQWTFQDGDALVVVVDRWAFEGLGERLAKAQIVTDTLE